MILFPLRILNYVKQLLGMLLNYLFVGFKLVIELKSRKESVKKKAYSLYSIDFSR